MHCHTSLPALRQYSVAISHLQNEEIQETISYAINVDSSREAKGQVTLNRHEVYKNGELPRLQADACVALSGKCIYPLTIKRNIQTRAHEIDNVKQIHQRWHIAKQQLNMQYNGDFVTRLIAHMDAVFEEKENVQKLVDANLFHQLHFLPQLTGNFQNIPPAFSIGLTLVHFCLPVQFACKTRVQKQHVGWVVYITGLCKDERSYTDLVLSKANVSGSKKDGCVGNLQFVYAIAGDGNVESIRGFAYIKGQQSEMLGIEVNVVYDNLVKLTSDDFDPVIQETVYAAKKPFWNPFKLS